MRRILGWLVGIAVACFAYGVLIERRAFRVRRVTVPVLPPGSPEVRVLHMSDIHLVARQRSKLRFITALSGLEPDLVVNTGDNISDPNALEPLLTAWGRLLNVPGVFVFGSNDYTESMLRNPLSYLVSDSSGATRSEVDLPWQELRDRMTERGWVDLTNRRTVLTIQGMTFEFRGTDDAHIDRDEYATVAGPASPGVDLSLGVTHAPYLRILNAMTRDDVDMIFAGHTHGGQVCVPGWGALITNCDLPPRHAKGLFRHKVDRHAAYVHVSAGLGMSPYAPYRFACPPEVTLVRLVSRPS